MVHLAATWETIGVLLFHGELTLDIIDDFFSGPILISWKNCWHTRPISGNAINATHGGSGSNGWQNA